MGRYVPPDLEGVVSFNQASGKGHPLGSRARNLPTTGALTVRFELPFSIWCTTCPKPTIIGQGVRFNAAKTKIGAYHSTPIYAFRFKHTACGGSIEIQTDPKNTAYVVTEGAKKRDTGEDRLKEGEIVIGGKSEEEKKRLEEDPFARAEEAARDKVQASTEKTRIEELYRRNERDWDDPGEVNRRLRRTFRVERKVRHRKAEATEALQERMGIGIDLLEEVEDDSRRAKLVEFGDVGDVKLDQVQAGPLFKSLGSKPGGPNGSKHSRKNMKASDQEQKEILRKELGNNTRAVMDPFLTNGLSKQQQQNMPVIKRKREESDVQIPREDVSEITPTQVPLVDYDSD